MAIVLGVAAPNLSPDISVPAAAQDAPEPIQLPLTLCRGFAHHPGPLPTALRPPSVEPTPAHTPTNVPTTAPTPMPTPTSTAAADCGSVPAFADGLTPAYEIHVAEDGDDGGGDGSLAAPYASIGRAARGAAPGAAIRVHSGTYAGGSYLEGLRGTAREPIWIGGAPGEEPPLIDGGSVGLHLIRPYAVALHDMKVRNTRNNGINVDDGGHMSDPESARLVLFERLDIADIGGDGNQDCLKLSGLRDFVVRDSRFASCGGGASGSGIDMVGGHDGVIARNSFGDHSGNAIQAKGGSGEIEIRWNTFDNGGHRTVNMGGSTGFDYFRPPLSSERVNYEAHRVRVLANVMRGSAAPLAFVGCHDCLAANNTIVDPERWLLRILQETTSRDGYEFGPASDGRLVNNLFYFERGRLATDVNVGPGTAPDTFVFASNLWFAHDAPERSQPRLPGIEMGSIVGLDPGFVSPGFAIGRGSPAAGAGTEVPELRGDLAGKCYADPPSIGAYEAAE